MVNTRSGFLSKDINRNISSKFAPALFRSKIELSMCSLNEENFGIKGLNSCARSASPENYDYTTAILTFIQQDFRVFRGEFYDSRDAS